MKFLERAGDKSVKSNCHQKSNLFCTNAALYFSINHCVIRIKVNIGTKWDQGKWMDCTA